MTHEFPAQITDDQYAALADIARLDSPEIREGVRRVVIEDERRKHVAADLKMGVAAVSNALGRLKSALATAQEAARPIGEHSAADRVSEAQFSALSYIARLRPQEHRAAYEVIVKRVEVGSAAASAGCSVQTVHGAVGRLLMALELAYAAAGYQAEAPRLWARYLRTWRRTITPT
ncbi:hypothetical protein CE206_29145 (plasmid) [Achromobacter xylosoxidans]|uniref:hypothetical protein n=1 Tax=Alcaligenes xylosoxydans xylosoxydans TaxID=85698 RepID=UPI000DD1674C|nr:hypothetical protein [Achromobacter xylosoxidans]AXA80639.1 hypothetical protein CE206_29145 [Achromobacter xylosoxidans]